MSCGLNLDQAKAFDLVSHCYMKRARSGSQGSQEKQDTERVSEGSRREKEESGKTVSAHACAGDVHSSLYF